MAEQPNGDKLGQVIRETRARLAEAGIDNPGLDARLLVEHISGTDRMMALRSPDMLIDDTMVSGIRLAAERRIGGEPVFRILGFREFYGLPLMLSPDTLEPRPDTEALVDAILPVARDIVSHSGVCRVLDLGTGSGAIALALLAQVPEAHAIATDISDGALATAAENAEKLGLAERFRALKSDWLASVEGQFDIIVSNPPYIRSADMERLQAEVRLFDPIRALDGGMDGLTPYRIISRDAKRHLAPGGTLAVEIGYDQCDDVSRVFADQGYALVSAIQDFGGNDRVLVFTR